MTTNTLPTFLPTSGGNTVPCFNVAGPLQIWGTTGATAAVEFLGWTRGGIEIQEQNNFAELKSDLNGGEQGIPGDYEWLGEMHTITCELAQYNPAILAKYERRMNVSITSRVIGQLLSCSGAGWNVLFLSLNFARLYTRAFVIEPVQYAPVGTPATFPRITFTGLGDAANTDISPYKTSGWTVTGAAITIP